MVRWCLAALVVVSGVADLSAAPVPVPRKANHKGNHALTNLAGVWDLVKLTRGKDDVGLLKVSSIQVAIRGNHWDFQSYVAGKPSPGAQYEIKLDTKKSPGWIDLERQSTATIKGIYAVDGDTLTVCYIPGSVVRPTTFERPPASAITMILKRIKP